MVLTCMFLILLSHGRDAILHENEQILYDESWADHLH